MSVPHPTANQILATRITRYRRLHRYTQRQLAELAGTTQATIARLERAEGNPTFTLITRISTTLNAELIIWFRPTPPSGPTPEWLEV